MKKLKQGAIMVCHECMAFVADRKAHRKWHKRHNRLDWTGPMGPQGPPGPMGMAGRDWKPSDG